MKSDPYYVTTAALSELGGQRVWSLMVTLFGDLAQAPGDSIDGPVLSAIMAAMDIRPEAVRVALHRLRKDGWITSNKTGRTSRHSLTPSGRAQTVAASKRIYADPSAQDENWQVVLLEDATSFSRAEMLQHGFAPLMPRTYIGSAHAQTLKGMVTLPGGEVTDWLRAQLEPTQQSQDYAELLQILAQAQSALPDQTNFSACQIAVLRCLIVHNWRRIILKHPDLPRALFPSDWAGHSCHASVDALLNRYPRPALTDILEP
ncbi:PaaX family transcriptional regulator [Sulfitobacter sp. SK012]|uniref:PaaX family transcriptional regulator C-terminal domain-containing protein n=1 Tax=Sulfitobacter sp. SK012 TaxID=1389005 RepID=UPI000E09F431|nr:PaaX family transcriptional regulator C-terminal domain-containing protein [Sulfitobacter sp. SK012]AXI44685.1 PaaX family transcriptional regulator [Sulfitobacter sp. SK012]